VLLKIYSHQNCWESSSFCHFFSDFWRNSLYRGKALYCKFF